MISLLLVRSDGVNPIDGVLGWRAVGCSGGVGRTGEVEELHCV